MSRDLLIELLSKADPKAIEILNRYTLIEEKYEDILEAGNKKSKTKKTQKMAVKRKTITVDLVAFKSLLEDSEALTALGAKVLEKANRETPEKYELFSDLVVFFHNANCGPLHRYARFLLEESEKEK